MQFYWMDYSALLILRYVTLPGISSSACTIWVSESTTKRLPPSYSPAVLVYEKERWLGLCATASEAFGRAAPKAKGQQKYQRLLQRKQYTESVELLPAGQRGHLPGHSREGVSLAYFKVGQYQESYAEYEGAPN